MLSPYGQCKQKKGERKGLGKLVKQFKKTIVKMHKKHIEFFSFSFPQNVQQEFLFLEFAAQWYTGILSFKHIEINSVSDYAPDQSLEQTIQNLSVACLLQTN